MQGIGSTKGTGDVDVAIALVDLAVATPESTITEWQRSNVLLAAGSWLETANRACQRRPEYKAYCIEWFDAVRIAEAAAELAASADRTGNTDYAGMSLDLRRRITARMLAEPARVGIAMLDCIAFERRAGNTDDVAALCDAVVADFRTVVKSCEEVSDPPFDEDRLALCQIVEVVKIRREICGPNPVDEELYDRCQALLARNDFS